MLREADAERHAVLIQLSGKKESQKEKKAKCEREGEREREESGVYAWKG